MNDGSMGQQLEVNDFDELLLMDNGFNGYNEDMLSIYDEYNQSLKEFGEISLSKADDDSVCDDELLDKKPFIVIGEEADLTFVNNVV